nr:putative reverse transcriptase, RNA-dependent DNA polymerase, Gag-polypeptide of LTR copia-type [Tanacetum cinerariifolium]
ESIEPYDDNKSDIPNKSTSKSRDSIVDDAVRTNYYAQTETLVLESKKDSVDVTCSTSNRKGNRHEEYATETSGPEGIHEYATETPVSKGIPSTSLNDDEYMSEGEDLKSFDKMFGWSPKLTAGQTVRRTSRKFVLRSKYNDFVLNKNVKYGIDEVINYANMSLDNYVFTTSLNKIHESTTYLEAVKDSRWVDAMNQEMEALNRNRTWEVVKLPNNRRDIRSKWVFKVKYKASGDVERLKLVHCLSQVMHSPMKSHLRLAFRVLRYLKKEPGLGITFKESDNANIRVFVDSNWAKCKVTRRSVTGAMCNVLSSDVDKEDLDRSAG